MPIHLTVHDSCFPRERQDRLVRALEMHRIPPAQLYTSEAQASRWLAYHEAWSPAPQPEVQAVYDRAFAGLTRPFPTWVSLGAGGGAKEARALASGTHAPDRYLPSDASAALVVESMLRMSQSHPSLSSRGLVIDLDVPLRRADFLTGDPRPALWLAFGILPNAPDTFLERLRTLLGPDDRVLLSANLSPHPFPRGSGEIVAQYDNAEARAWLQGALVELGLHPARFELVVRPEPLRPDGRAWRIHGTARMLREQTVHVRGTDLRWPAGAELRIFRSDRFTPEGVRDRVAQAGLQISAEYIAPQENEGVFELGKRPDPGSPA